MLLSTRQLKLNHFVTDEVMVTIKSAEVQWRSKCEDEKVEGKDCENQAQRCGLNRSSVYESLRF